MLLGSMQPQVLQIQEKQGVLASVVGSRAGASGTQVCLFLVLCCFVFIVMHSNPKKNVRSPVTREGEKGTTINDPGVGASRLP